jgi:hypothetical protein
MPKVHRTPQFTAGTKSDAKSWVRPLICIDLGFSQSSRSCGFVAIDGGPHHAAPVALRFHDAIERTVAIASGCPLIGLVLEAPLSAKFDGNGNPMLRGKFETLEHVEKAKIQRRHWYVGAGAATLLAAVFFLRKLRERLRATSNGVGIYLFEALLTFKRTGTPHQTDAADILTAFQNHGAWEVVQGRDEETVLSILSLLEPDEAEGAAPDILIVPSGASAAKVIAEAVG